MPFEIGKYCDDIKELGNGKHKCIVCGNVFGIYNHELYTYKYCTTQVHVYLCSYRCFKEFDRARITRKFLMKDVKKYIKRKKGVRK